MKKTKIWNYVSAVMMLVVLVMQFMPFWHYDGMSTSIQTYIWFPTDQKDLTSYLTAQLGADYNINSIVLAPIVILVSYVAGIVLAVIKGDNPWCKLVPIIGSLVGIWGFLVKPAYHLGSAWVVQLILCIGVAATAVIAMVKELKE